MPDISMCKNDKCPLKEECYRYKARPNSWYQTYTDFEFTVEDGCVYFLPLKEKKDEG